MPNILETSNGDHQQITDNGTHSQQQEQSPGTDNFPRQGGPPVEEYEPDLNPTQNPHYYHINQVLYEAHTARQARHKSPLQNPYDGR